MKRIACFAICSTLLMLSGALSHADVFELRTYTVHEGKLDALNSRFRDHTVRIFKKHGMESVGYWVPTDKPLSENTLVYVLRHKSRQAAKESWAAFIKDPQWQKAFKESRKAGPIVKKVKSVFMEATDYSPKFKAGKANADTVFELRIYRTHPDRLKNLDARFRDHTIRIFSRHGLESVAYWHPLDAPDSADTLIYILKHSSREGAAKAWKAFSQDPEWKKAAKESRQSGPILRQRPESTYMRATDYSPIQ